MRSVEMPFPNDQDLGLVLNIDRGRKRKIAMGFAVVCALMVSACSGSLGMLGSTAVLKTASPAGETPDQHSTHCKPPTADIALHVAEIVRLQDTAVKGADALPTTLAQIWHRAIGPRGDGTAAADQVRDRRRTIAGLNSRLVELGCPAVDVEAAITAKKASDLAAAGTKAGA
jgi:hypothetical protein